MSVATHEDVERHDRPPEPPEGPVRQKHGGRRVHDYLSVCLTLVLLFRVPGVLVVGAEKGKEIGVEYVGFVCLTQEWDPIRDPSPPLRTGNGN